MKKTDKVRNINLVDLPEKDQKRILMKAVKDSNKKIRKILKQKPKKEECSHKNITSVTGAGYTGTMCDDCQKQLYYNPSPHKEGWEKEFDELTKGIYFDCERWGHIKTEKKIKTFIRQTIEEVYQKGFDDGFSYNPLTKKEWDKFRKKVLKG